MSRSAAEPFIRMMPVAGPRLSRWAEGGGFALAVVGEVIQKAGGGAHENAGAALRSPCFAQVLDLPLE